MLEQFQVGLTLSQATKALRESRGIALLYFRPLHQKGVRGQHHAPAAPYPQERPGTHCTGGWVGLRASLDWCRKSRPTGIRSLDHPARRQSQYRLRYPAHVGAILLILKCFNNSTFFNVVCISWKLKCWIYTVFFLNSHGPLVI